MENKTQMIISIGPFSAEYTAGEALFIAGGLLTQWAINCPSELRLKDFMIEQYREFARGAEMPAGSYLDEHDNFCFEFEGEKDVPLAPQLKFTRKLNGATESVYIYPHSICAFLFNDEKPTFIRMD